MLRRSAARAFGTDAGRLEGAEAPPGGSRGLGADVLFEDLREALASGLRRLRDPGAAAESAPAGSPGPPSAGAESTLTLSDPRPRLEGVEFVLEGPGGRVRCSNTLRGFLRIEWEGPEGAFREIVAAERRGGSDRPIEKPLAPAPGGSRTSFRFTSVAELAERCLEFARGAARGPRAQTGDGPR